MKSWLPMLLAGATALVGGLFALINPTSAAVSTATLAGWVFVLVALFQVWAVYKSETTMSRLRAGLIAAVSLFLGVSLLFGPFGQGVLLRWLIGVPLLLSGGAKIYAGRAVANRDNRMIIYGTAMISCCLGLVLLYGLNINYGILLGLELLSSGLALMLLALARKALSQ